MVHHIFNKIKNVNRYGNLPKKEIWLIPEFLYRTLKFSDEIAEFDYTLIVSDNDLYELQTLEEIKNKKPLIKIRNGENIPLPTAEQITELHKQLAEIGLIE
tara:strand:+ start:412 stop:714 length:303 start_codon:yes stop_codon:yes gene_type:complete